MRLFVFASGLALAVASSSADQRFERFKKKFKRHYASKEEESYRHEIFNRSLAFIENENAKGKSYTLGVTKFADLTFHEWRSQYLTGFVPSAKKSNFSVFRAPAGFVLPDSVDWTEHGAVTPVQNQAHCGSCWTFSTTGALEGASVVAGRPLTKLSEQNILDCDTGGHKCRGGSMDQAFFWVAQNGLLSEDDDPYKCADQSSSECTSSTCPAGGNQVLQPGDVTDHTDVDHTEGALEAAVAQQPVSVAIEADQSVFQHYTGGVLSNDACGQTLDHGVLVVGYGTDNDQKYWKVKNSWGTDHGEEGYWRIERGSAEPGGECGIRKAAVFPTVKAPNSQILV